MRTLGLLLVCGVVAAIAGCGGGATTDCKVPPDRDLLLAVRAHAGPITLPTQTHGGNAGRLTITACQTSDTEATATLTVFSISSETTRDVRHGMKLEKQGGTWKITSDSDTRRCQTGHGNDREFSSATCR